MPEQLITGPSAEPVDLLAAKVQCRVTDSAQDATLRRNIAGARWSVQAKTGLQLVHARYCYERDAFDACAIELPRAPLVRVVSIEYLDMAGTWQTVPAVDYVAQASRKPPRVALAFGKAWPATLPQIGAVRITNDVGYASPITASGANITVRGPVTWAVDAAVRFSNSGGALPAPLVAMTDYYIKTAAAGVYTVAATVGGAAIVTTDAGTGTSFIGEIPEGLLDWMQIRIATLYENREEVAILNRGKVEPLPHIEGLLDPYRIVRA